MSKELVLAALDSAVKTHKPSAGLITHTDRGSQYTSLEYRNKVEQELKFKLSYSRKGCPYDSAVIGIFSFNTQKGIGLHYHLFDVSHARFELFQYIEGFYNRKRIQ